MDLEHLAGAIRLANTMASNDDPVTNTGVHDSSFAWTPKILRRLNVARRYVFLPGGCRRVERLTCLMSGPESADRKSWSKYCGRYLSTD
jgi:hypothetical protein